MKLIETKTISSTTAAIEFTNVPQDGTDLVAICSTRTTTATVVGAVRMALNGNNGYQTRLVGGGSGNAFSDQIDPVLGLTSTNANTSNTFGSCIFYVTNYTLTAAKSASYDSVQERNGQESYQQIGGGLWGSFGGVTTVTFTAGADSFVAGTTISLYKITKGTDGIVTTSP
jgi:hypothetical protein